MPLNKEQQSVFLQIIDFINGPAKAMDLSGRGGTGKTYLIGHIVNNIMPFIKNEKIQTIAVTATTNKAAAVLNGSIPGYDQNVGTIYTYMNLRLSENYTTGATSIVPTQNWEVKSNTLIIIDECSMVNADLFHYLQIGIDSSCKILYVGDSEDDMQASLISGSFFIGFGNDYSRFLTDQHQLVNNLDSIRLYYLHDTEEIITKHPDSIYYVTAQKKYRQLRGDKDI